MDPLPPLYQVEGLQCYLPDSNRIRQQSILEVKTNADLTSGRLGCRTWDSLCEHCGQSAHQCYGHTAHMELPVSCFHVGTLPIIIKILNSLCFYCHKLRIDASMYNQVLELPAERRINSLQEYARYFRTCACGHAYIKWTKESGHDNILRGVVTLTKQDIINYKNDPTWHPIQFGPNEIHQLLDKISNDEHMMRIMGFGPYNLPRARMFTALAVPALSTRPNNTFPTKNGAKQYPNDWTKMLKNVLQSKLLLELKLRQSNDPIILTQYQYKSFIHPDFRVCIRNEQLTSEARKRLNHQQKQQYKAQLQLVNQKLSKCKLSKESSYEMITNQCAWRNLQNQISAFHFEKYRKLIPKNSQYGKTPSSVDTKFKKTSKSKQSSRMQGYIVAWRKYHYARLVLEGCTWIHPTYCGIPQKVCMGLTIKVPVSTFNMALAHKWILNGPQHYPGANTIIMKDGREVDLEHYDNRRDIDIKQVAYVFRHVLENDWVIVNRAPTLHRGSTMGFQVTVVPNSFVINLHVCVFLPFNADCDGDELSIHIPQTIEARSEVMNIMNVKNHTMKDGSLWIKFGQNASVGIFLLTHLDTFLTKNQVSILLGHLKRFFTLPPPAIQKPIPLWTGKQVFSVLLPSVKTIINAVVTEDVLNNYLKEIIIYHSLDEAMNFLFEGYLVAQEYLDMRGHSCSYHQLYWEEADAAKNFHKLQGIQHESEEVVGQHIQVYTKAIQDQVEKIVLQRDRNTLHNGYLAMIQSGTKANLASLTQMMGVVGQTYLTHERIPRVTSHFEPNDKSLVAHGFIQHPYALGLTFHDLMTQSQPTTESVINKIKGTSASGYLEKKMAYCNMGMVADTFGHAIDSYSGNRRQHAFRKEDIQKPGPTVWYHYGGDALDPQYLVWETITPPTEQQWPHNTHSFYDESWTLWHKIQHLDLKFKSPFLLKHLFQDAKDHFTTTDLSPEEVIDSFVYIWNSMVKERIVPAQHHKMHVLLRLWCCPHNVIQVWKLSSQAWYKLLNLIYHGIRRRNVIPGEAVGMNLTHCVGEVHTQNILKSPHASGKKMQLTGCGRLTHLIDANNTLATMNIVFLPDVTEAEVHYTAMTWRTVFLSEILQDYPKIDASSMTIRLSIDPEKKDYYLIQDFHIILAIHHTMQIPIAAIHQVDPYLFCIKLTSSVNIWSFAMKQIKHHVPDATSYVLYGIAYNIFHQTIVRGKQDGVSKYIIHKNAMNRWVCVTDQSDFSIWSSHPLVDVIHSYSTHTGDVQKFMGIYATTQVVTNEFINIMGNSTDVRHLELMARYMTMSGIHEGYKKNEAAKRIAPMQQASFEESSKHIMENCDMGRWDPGNTIAAAAMCNKNMNLGSGYAIQLRVPDTIPFRPTPIEYTPQRHVMIPFTHGTRSMLVFTTYKNCIQLFMMDSTKKISKLQNMPSKLPIPLFAGTILDGHLLTHNNCFIISDCYMMCGHSTKHLRYDQRWELAIQAIHLIAQSPLATLSSITISPNVIKSSLYPHLFNAIVRHTELPFGLHVKPMVELKHIERFQYELSIDGYDLMDTSAEVSTFLRLPSHHIYCLVKAYTPIKELPWPHNTPPLAQHYRFYRGAVFLFSSDGVLVTAAELSLEAITVQLPCVMKCIYNNGKWIALQPSPVQESSWKDITHTMVSIAEHITPRDFIL